MTANPLVRIALVCLASALMAAGQTASTAPAPPREPGLYATIVTSQGTIVTKLFEKESPVTVKNFVGLATGQKTWTHPKTGVKMVKRPLYNGLTFHRVIPNFMIQGGDPLGTGEGGTEPIKDEFDPSLTFDRPGRLAMANAGPGTGSCQFFITEVPTPHLNGGHTIFGQVVDGQEVVDKIAHLPRNADNKPNTPVRMVRVSVRRVGATAPVKAKPAAAKPKAVKPAGAKPATAKPKAAAPAK